MLFEDNPGDALLVRESLNESKLGSFHVECVERLSDGLERLTRGGIDIVLLDLALQDSFGIETFEKVQFQTTDTPLVVFTSNDDKAFALKTIQEGGQDYIIKGQIDSQILARTIIYAIERHHIGTRFKKLSYLDELTGLYNRRGFFSIAEQHIKLAQQTKKDVLVIYADLDDLKQINDTFGHKKGDLALIETANILRITFRDSDIIARIGGDEFAIFSMKGGDVNFNSIKETLQASIEDSYAKGNYFLKLSISVGFAYLNHNHLCSVDSLLQEADKMMYQEKRAKSASRYA